MKKTLLFIAVLCICFSCKKNDKKTSAEVVPVEKNSKDAKVEEEEDYNTLTLSDEISDFLENEMSGHEIVDPESWLAEEYLDGFSTYARPKYNEDILIEGDFNGDGEEDFATFLVDKKGNISLYAFHKTNDGYKKYLLQKEGKPEFLGAGLALEDPGFIYGGNKEVGLEYNAIIYNIYEKTGTTYYYDSGRYRKVLTSD